MIVFRDLPWNYAEMLEWTQENGYVKAFPKRPLSDRAHKIILVAFRKWGGKFVRHDGVAYFEVAVDKPTSTSTKVAVDVKRAYEELTKEA